MKEIKKTSIGDIWKNQKKLTIVDTIVHESAYFLVPPLTLSQLAACWLDPSEMEGGLRYQYLVYIANEKIRLGKPAKDCLLHYLQETDALNSHAIYFKEENRFEFGIVKPKILKKFGLRNIRYKTEDFSVSELIIESNVPLYDEHAHERHVQNLLSAIKRRHPESTAVLDIEGCRTGGKCSIGIATVLRKIAEQNSKESR